MALITMTSVFFLGSLGTEVEFACIHLKSHMHFKKTDTNHF